MVQLPVGPFYPPGYELRLTLLRSRLRKPVRTKAEGLCRGGPVSLDFGRLTMKVRVFPDALMVVLALLGALSLIDELWRAPTPLPLLQFLQTHHLSRAWNALRWQHMYSHEVLHFLSGVVGSMVGCWIYFAIQRKRDDSE